MAEPVLMSPWIPVFSAFGGSLITGFVNLFMNRLNQQSEERKHKLSLIMNSAIEYWKQQLDSAFKLVKGTDNKIKALPLDAYMIHMTKLSEILDQKHSSSKDIISEIKELNNFMAPILKAYEETNYK